MEDPLPRSTHLAASHIVENSTLPLSTHLTGTITLVWGSLTSIKWSGQAITCFLKATLSSESPASSDYVPSGPNGQTRSCTSFRLVLRPSSMSMTDDGDLKRMEEERTQLLRLVGKTVAVDCSGLKVDKVEKQGATMSVYLEGSGERQIATESGVMRILAGQYCTPRSLRLAEESQSRRRRLQHRAGLRLHLYPISLRLLNTSQPITHILTKKNLSKPQQDPHACVPYLPILFRASLSLLCAARPLKVQAKDRHPQDHLLSSVLELGRMSPRKMQYSSTVKWLERSYSFVLLTEE